jgi:hypothetical protein
MAVAGKAQWDELVGQELHWSIESILEQRPSELLANHVFPLFLPRMNSEKDLYVLLSTSASRKTIRNTLKTQDRVLARLPSTGYLYTFLCHDT